MKILITGMQGFTGKYLKNTLEAHGHTVFGLKCDLTDANAIAAEISNLQPEVVVHLASISNVAHGSANAIYQVNIIGTRNLLYALDKHAKQLRSVLLASSANIYGNSSQSILSETALPAPANDYSVSKYAMEQMAHLWSDRLPLFIVRPFNYTGIGQDERFLIPKIVAHFQQRKPIIELGNLDVWREFGDVRVVVDVYRKLLELAPRGETINVCTGRAYSLKEVISMCEKISGHTIEIKVNSQFVRPNEVRILKGDNSFLKKLVRDFKIYDLEETLRWMLSKNSLISQSSGTDISSGTI